MNTSFMKASVATMSVFALALAFMPMTASASNDQNGVMVSNHNSARVNNQSAATANTGDNYAAGSESGHGGRGGDIAGSGDDVEGNTTGNGGRGGDATGNGTVRTGDAIATSLIDNTVNSNRTNIDRCSCEESEGGKTRVSHRNEVALNNYGAANAHSGDNGTGGSDAASGGRGGDIAGSGDDVEDNTTGHGHRGGDANGDGSVMSGKADAMSSIVNVVNRNMTRIRR